MLRWTFIFFHSFTYISTKSIIEQLQSTWKSFFSVIVVKALNKDQVLIQMKWLEKVQHFENAQPSLLKKCLYSSFSRIRTEYGEIRSIYPYLARMRENADQKNSEYEHFSCSGYTLGTCVTLTDGRLYFSVKCQ